MGKLISFISNFYGLIFFLILAVFIWTPIHEFLHVSVLKFLNYDYILSWNFFIMPNVRCQTCDITNKQQMFFYNIFPYFVDLLAIAIGFLFYKNKILSYLMHFGYFDILSNSFAMVIALIAHLPNDLLNVIKLGFWYFVIILLSVSSYLWLKKNKNILIGIIKKYHTFINKNPKETQ